MARAGWLAGCVTVLQYQVEVQTQHTLGWGLGVTTI